MEPGVLGEVSLNYLTLLAVSLKKKRSTKTNWELKAPLPLDRLHNRVIKRELLFSETWRGVQQGQPVSSKGFYLLACDASVYRRLQQVQYLEVVKIYVLLLLPDGVFPASWAAA